MSLLPALFPPDFFTESPVYPLSPSLLLHLKRCLHHRSACGAVRRSLSCWLQVTWSSWPCCGAPCMVLSPTSRGVSGVLPSVSDTASRTEWELRLYPKSPTSDLARVSQSFEASNHMSPGAFLWLQVVQRPEAARYDHAEIVCSARRLQQTSNYLVWCKTWKLLKWNNIFPFENLLTIWEVSRGNSYISM